MEPIDTTPTTGFPFLVSGPDKERIDAIQEEHAELVEESES